MAYQFDSNNPFNIRGLKISPQAPNSDPPTPKNNVNYYFIYIDVVNDGSDVGTFTLSNPLETGSNLTYTWNPSGPITTLTVPTASSVTRTLVLPLYTNQNIDQPNSNQDNLFAVLSANGTSYKGNPNKGIPPVFDKIYASPALTCFPVLVKSETDSGVQWLVVLANTGTNPALNTGSITSIVDGDGTYTLRFWFDNVTESKPGQGHPVVCIANDGVGSNLNQFSQLYTIDPTGLQGPIYPLGASGWPNVPVKTI